MSEFRTPFGEKIFQTKYAQYPGETWAERAHKIVDWVTGTMGGTKEPLLPKSERDELERLLREFKWLPGGRYIYYAGREANFWSNCYVVIGTEDTREEWTRIVNDTTGMLMTGGGVGIDYSIFRPKGVSLKRTGGVASGPIPLMKIINEIGRNVIQGGSRRSALFASLNWQHGDAQDFLKVKNWHDQKIAGSNITVADAKKADFNYHADLDMTNISLNYDNAFLAELESGSLPDTFVENVRQALMTGEPGFAFNFGEQENETGRNACTEFISSDSGDVCNLGSPNIGAFDTLEEFGEAVRLVSKFLYCGTLRGQVPFEKVRQVREKNKKQGMEIMGVHEWLLKRGYRYEMNDELRKWLKVFKDESEYGANELADRIGNSRPTSYRALGPTGSISLMAGTSSGMEPLFAVAYQRRFLTGGKEWKFQYVIDGVAQNLIDTYGLDPDDIESAIDLAAVPERRIKFQADIQDPYIDMGISSTINMPQWGSPLNNEDLVEDFARTLAKYAPRLRGFTVYPDGSRGGQPLVPCDYNTAKNNLGVTFDTVDVCELTGGGSCGV